ncbi:glycerol-3-phosphate 1-O-acyltransferase PlsY [Croceimicrobium hydrocarbonivorans]|uniref:Glycerol-3-phosphate acyltransferase n=1 Tax=Croceimicrobium hydrocarbonivorans TaxID=2761580 RepID=A0A7H0VCM4_9FLAO|nr:glycerol-3-phosphate 1-O-acyltransferase PlsY [Croceimicrobium hydrocarbonivorans]QNR23472.1 glycerol-3-phosphate 1-O-acyltransferase PlsY [Croceimicrobium hydrocarbonivorans]
MIIALLLIAYFLGSLAWSVWIGRWMFGIDLREHGSGNAGATNAFRVLGKQAGTLVLVLDVLKGFAAVKLIHLLPADQQSVIAMLGLGFLAVFGHLFPIYVGFRGGKGIATLLGVVIALHSGAALLAMGVFVAFLLATRIVSVSSMAAALSLPLWLIYRFKEPSEVLIIFSFAIALLVLITHRKNIVRLLRGEENKVKLKRKRAED